MADIPKVCVITRTRNRPALLKRAIESVLAQSMTDWQHVIVNDGGDVDELEAVCSKYKKAYAGRLLVLNEKHKGMQQASNTAIEQTDSVYVTIHDDDDAWHKDFLKRTTGFLNRKGVNSDYQGVITESLKVREEEMEDGSFRETGRTPYVPLKEVGVFRIGYENPFPPIALLYRRSVHASIGFFDPTWDMVADLEFNFRFLQKFDIGVVTTPLAYYHWRETGAKGVNANTVTTKKRRHAQYLNELKNHYLRRSDSLQEAVFGLSFHLSSYLVENQWMTAEVLDNGKTAKRLLTELRDEVAGLERTSREAVIPVLAKSIIPKLEDLLEATGCLEILKHQLEQIKQFNEEALLPRVAKEIIPKINHIQTACEHFIEINKSLDELKAFDNEAAWPKLESLNKDLAYLIQFVQGNSESTREKLEALESQVEGVGKVADAHSNKSEESHAGHAKDLRQLSDSTREKLEALESQIEGVGKVADAHSDKSEESHAGHAKDLRQLSENQERDYQALANISKRQEQDMESIREELSKLREASQRQWQLGRLRIQWLEKTGRDKEVLEGNE